MRILAVDVGTGTQDILLFDSRDAIENSIQMVMPSPTALVAERVRGATRRGSTIALHGVTMGGGPSMWAVEDHLRAGLPVVATPLAAQSFDDDLDRIRALGITLVDPSEIVHLPDAESIELRDFYHEPIVAALRAFGVEPELDAVAIAVFDHGAAPPGESDRIFRFRYLAETLARDNDLTALAYPRASIPSILTRMGSVAATVPEDLPLVVMDTGPAAILGALEDPNVGGQPSIVAANVGNFHALACHLEDGQVVGLFEHHTGELTAPELADYLARLGRGDLTSQEVYDDMGHGAIVWPRRGPPPSRLAVTGPRRGMLRDVDPPPYFAVPHGDMMLAGCFGLLRACVRHLPGAADDVAARLSPSPR